MFVRSSKILNSKLYNHKFKTKIGFYNAKKSNVCNNVPNNKTWNHMKQNADNYGILINKDVSKLDTLHHTITKLLADNPKSRIGIYSDGSHAKLILQSSKLIKTLPGEKCQQHHILKIFKRGGCILLFIENSSVKLNIDAIIHYDLPRSIDTFTNRLFGNNVNILFYNKVEQTFIAHLQNHFNFILSDWVLPSKSIIIDNFVNELEELISKTDQYDLKMPEDSKFNRNDVLASLLYMLHYKLRGLKRKQYLLYDPKFKMFKTRQSVVKFLNENGIYNYNSIHLTRRGFIIETFDTLDLPSSIPVFNYKRINSHLLNIKKRLERSYISSPINKSKIYKKLKKHEESKLIKILRYKNIKN